MKLSTINVKKAIFCYLCLSLYNPRIIQKLCPSGTEIKCERAAIFKLALDNFIVAFLAMKYTLPFKHCMQRDLKKKETASDPLSKSKEKKQTKRILVTINRDFYPKNPQHNPSARTKMPSISNFLLIRNGAIEARDDLSAIGQVKHLIVA